jgi:hypothetical protein
MNQNDIALAAGGITAPLWLQALNDWLGLVAVSLTIVLLAINIWKSRKK